MGSDEERDQREQGVDALRADPEERARREDPLEQEEEQHGRIPQSRIGRSAKLGTVIGTQATRYAATAAANVVRSDEKAEERLETRHLETALKMASVLGEMKGAAMKIGQMASFIDVDFLPPEYREIYQERLSKLRTSAPAMPWEKVREVLDRGVRRAPRARLRRDRGGGVRRRLHRAGSPGDPPGRDEGRGQDSVPGDRGRARVRRGQRGHPGAPGQGAGAGARREGRCVGAARARPRGARLRVRGAEPAGLRACLRRAPVHLRPEGPLAALAGGGCWSRTMSRAAASTR